VTDGQFVSVPNVALLLDVSAATVRKLIRQGHLNAIRLPGGTLKVDRVALAEFVASAHLPQSRAGAP
jgi:excisionase family DNA binding protein